MRLKFLMLAILFIAACSKSFAQEYRNTVFAELLGNGYYYSINYEREFKNQFIGRIGFSTLDNDFIFPLTLGKFFGKKNSHFELSAGIDFVSYQSFDEPRDKTIIVTGFMGYRYQKPDNRLQFRIGFTPLYDPSGDSFYGFIPSGGMSFGYRF